MTLIKPKRTALYMPASNQRALEKAPGLAVDCIILDLEDSVAPDLKAVAREQAAARVRAGGFGAKQVVIRVNGIGTEWFAADMAAAIAAGPDAILVPKVSSTKDIEILVEMRDRLGGAESLSFWAMIETALAILNVQDILKTAEETGARLSCLVMGNNDLAKETGVRLLPGRAALVPWMMTALAAARAYGLDILDGVFNAIDDEAGFGAECEQGRDFGFDGKTIIHPKQIAIANEVFQPSAAEVADARAIVAAFALPENGDKGVIMLEGRMVERLHLQMAVRVLAMAEAIAE